MDGAKCRINGSEYIGVFCTASENLIFVAESAREKEKSILASTLKARVVSTMLAGSELVGIFAKANSNGIVISELAYEHEVEALKQMKLGINIEVLNSNLNAVGCNILTNDKIAIINKEYSTESSKKIGDALGVEIVRSEIGHFRTIGANNILTNSGLAINNRAEDSEKAEWDGITKFDSIRTTANTGGLAIGLAVAANSKGVVVGESTTGFEMARIIEALEGQ